MTKSNKNLLLGAAVVVGAIYLYRRNQNVASGEETSSFLGFRRGRAGRTGVRRLAGASTTKRCAVEDPRTGQISYITVPAGQSCPSKAEYRRTIYGAASTGL